MRNTIAMVAAVWLGGSACTGGTPTDVNAGTGLTLSALTDTEVSGRFVDPEHVIEFSIVEADAGRVALDLSIDDVSIHYDADLVEGNASYDLPSMKLGISRVAAITALHMALAETLEGPDKTTAVDQLLRSTSFLARAPVRSTLQSFDFINTKGWTYIGCSCRYRYIGNGYYRTTGKGSYCTGGYGNGCKGRCGIGCNWGGHGAYTRDCALHDYGLQSWTRAADDYSFAAWNC